MSEQAKRDELWIGCRKSGKYTAVQGYEIETRIILAECDTRELATEIVLNAQKANAFDVMVERGWRVWKHAIDDKWCCGNLECFSDPLGSGPTPLAAIIDAERRTKGGA